ncbi:hypothetical protein [Edaphobacter sp.]|uniref:hypothetical protein n=1 Tax=Edaphobacter sp. TaxID=1934404 RepID=UPI002DB914BB|nr:hypothetical protein [Edaphobacter sp.]HEU5342243.1 hypothetical protein [Edaphobacter sp.]
MKHSEPLLEEVLSGLRDAEPSPGMERRILAALEARTHHPAQTHQRRLMQFTRAFALPAACGLAALLALVFLIPSMRRKRVSTQPAQTISSLQPAPARIRPEQAPAQATAPISHKATTHRLQKPLPRDSYETLAEIETRAPSLPAPPMPLTDEEKLLLRLIQARNPIELASLDHAAWTLQLAKDKAQFDQFFAPPKTVLTGDKP